MQQGYLCTPLEGSCSRCDTTNLHRRHSDRLSTTFMLSTGTHTDLFGNILKQVGGKRCAENTDALALHMINRMRKEPNCFGTLEICWSHSLLRSLSFRAGLSQINNLCNILSQSVHSNSLVANWHLTHYCIKVIFCGNNVCILYFFGKRIESAN